MMRKLSKRKKARNTNIKERGGSGVLMRSRTKTVPPQPAYLKIGLPFCANQARRIFLSAARAQLPLARKEKPEVGAATSKPPG